MPRMAIALILAIFLSAHTNIASAYSINGKYATLVPCDFAYSEARDESGYTGTYLVFGEYWTVYFGDADCAGGPV